MLQRSAEWLKARAGMVTSSRFKDVMTPKRGKKEIDPDDRSATAQAYMKELLTERSRGVPIEKPVTAAMKWGMEWEDTAREKAYDRLQWFVKGEISKPEGENAFIFLGDNENTSIGCSPDMIIEGGNAGGEIKCPANSVYHVGTVHLREMPEKYEYQVQGSMWVMGLPEYWYISFDPRFDKQIEIADVDGTTKLVDSPTPSLFIIRVERDEEFIAKMSPVIEDFRDELDDRWNYMLRTKIPNMVTL